MVVYNQVIIYPYRKILLEEVQKFIENSKAFKRGVIIRVKTPEELAIEKKKAEQEKRLKFWQETVKRPGVKVDFFNMSDSDIRKTADEIGVSTSKNGRKRSKEEIAMEIYELVYGKKYEKSVKNKGV